MTMIPADGVIKVFTGSYKIADRTVRVTSLYEDVHTYCSDYRIDMAEDPDIEVVISQDDIDYERSRSGNPEVYRATYLEELAVYRKIAEKMPYYDSFLMHGSVVAVDGEAYMFTAKSGTGKSTHAALWRRLLGDRAVMVNDDKPIINAAGGKATVYGTPYNGKHHLGNNISVPLKAVCILRRGDVNRISEISREEAYPVLLQQIYRPSDKDAFVRTLTLIDELTKSVKFYILNCNMDINAAQTAYNAMKG